jgi:hypothetical protein
MFRVFSNEKLRGMITPPLRCCSFLLAASDPIRAVERQSENGPIPLLLRLARAAGRDAEEWSRNV